MAADYGNNYSNIYFHLIIDKEDMICVSSVSCLALIYMGLAFFSVIVLRERAVNLLIHSY